ncbi:SMI1/KNR4 family protein [Aquabacterium humicola]|uniref:SMI1/KNR4 family protein n=1 Tax=Aquabacterium humicola TaxID=3237377 RepID=UPI0025439382|nr:SMI1/KNR4 family protein [Rubrivivax pictus]
MPHARVIGTTEEALAAAEVSLGRALPPTFRNWLLRNNGTGIEDVVIFPVLDERDKRKTWDSITRQTEVWQSYCSDVFPEEPGRFQGLQPFAEFGTGDYYCFDYSAISNGEPQVVRWSHETGEASFRATSFTDFVARLVQGEFELD